MSDAREHHELARAVRETCAAVLRGEQVSQDAIEAAVCWLDMHGLEAEAADLAVRTDPEREEGREAATAIARAYWSAQVMAAQRAVADARASTEAYAKLAADAVGALAQLERETIAQSGIPTATVVRVREVLARAGRVALPAAEPCAEAAELLAQWATAFHDADDRYGGSLVMRTRTLLERGRGR